MKLLVLDGNSVLNRAFYGIKLLTTKNGQYTNAIYGFMNILLKLEENQKPDEIAIAFDLKAPTFRHEMYDKYKAHRKGMPEELAQQMPILKQLLNLLGYKEISLAGFEADDILGTLAQAAAKRGDECLLATGDRDSLQLVQKGVSVLLTTTQFGRGETTCMDELAIMEKYGVTPPQLIETKALMGDASDNIPGVAGVGEKTAFALIKQFGTTENVYKNINDESIKEGVRKKLIAGEESAKLSYKLAVINCDVPVPTQTGAYVKTASNIEEASALLSQLEMYSILERLSFEVTQTELCENVKPLENLPLKPLESLEEGLVYLYQDENTWFVMPHDGKFVYSVENDSELLLNLLRNEKIEKRAYNAKALHKIALSANENLPAQNISFDLKLAAYLLNPNGSDYALDRTAAEYGAKANFACEGAQNAPLLQPLFEKLFEKLNETEMYDLLCNIELPLAEVLASMELCGFYINADGVRAFGKELEIEIASQQASIFAEVGYEFNLNSPKQLGEALFEKMQLPHGKKTKTGWSTNAQTLEGLRKYEPVIDTILLYRTYQKLNSTYIEGLLKEIGDDGRIHSTFNQTEARTGRISSNEPNLQNIPIRTKLGSRLREFFTAQGDEVLVDADYSQIELRILASISGDEAMQQAFEMGEDIHKATAANVHRVALDDVTSEMRSSAKAVNFGIVYGIGAFSLSKDIGVSVKEADQFIQNYLDSFPGVRKYMEGTIEFGKVNGYVKTLYNRRRPVPELVNSNRNVQASGQRIALNTPIQGTAADVIKLAMICVFKRLREEKLEAKLILQVHDELIVKAPESEAKYIGELLCEEMENAAKLSVCLKADVHIGKNWLIAKG